jgi:Zn-dependent protease/predicted transcriptional regulator
LRDSFTIGRIAGVRVGLNWTWLIVFALITWTLARAVFPDQNPGYSDVAYVVMALLASALFFLSLLAHEYGHAWRAIREGMEIEGITLWLFGGVAKFKGMFPSAGAEFRIAIAGPLVSLLLGAAFTLAAWLAPLPDYVDGVCAWLGYINLSLLVFNLLPALPLDGGRVLRSALWHFKGSFSWATHVAALIGKGFGYLFIGGGVALLIWESAFSGAWLAFIGWFLLQAAGAEDRFGRAREALEGLRVRQLMVRQPIVAPADLTIAEFMDDLVWNRRYTTYPVVDDGRVIGLAQLKRIAEVPRSEWDTRTVRDSTIPLAEVPVVGPDDEIADAALKLSESGLNRGLVMEGDLVVGLVSMTDVAQALELREPRRRR